MLQPLRVLPELSSQPFDEKSRGRNCSDGKRTLTDQPRRRPVRVIADGWIECDAAGIFVVLPLSRLVDDALWRIVHTGRGDIADARRARRAGAPSVGDVAGDSAEIDSQSADARAIVGDVGRPAVAADDAGGCVGAIAIGCVAGDGDLAQGGAAAVIDENSTTVVLGIVSGNRAAGHLEDGVGLWDRHSAAVAVGGVAGDDAVAIGIAVHDHIAAIDDKSAAVRNEAGVAEGVLVAGDGDMRERRRFGGIAVMENAAAVTGRRAVIMHGVVGHARIDDIGGLSVPDALVKDAAAVGDRAVAGDRRTHDRDGATPGVANIETATIAGATGGDVVLDDAVGDIAIVDVGIKVHATAGTVGLVTGDCTTGKGDGATIESVGEGVSTVHRILAAVHIDAATVAVLVGALGDRAVVEVDVVARSGQKHIHAAAGIGKRGIAVGNRVVAPLDGHIVNGDGQPTVGAVLVDADDLVADAVGVSASDGIERGGALDDGVVARDG